MARYQVLYWKDIPAQVKAAGEDRKTVSRALPERFQEQIDERAMREGLIGSDEYLNQWRWTEKRERAGSAEEVAEAVAREIEQQFPG